MAEVLSHFPPFWPDFHLPPSLEWFVFPNGYLVSRRDLPPSFVRWVITDADGNRQFCSAVVFYERGDKRQLHHHQQGVAPVASLNSSVASSPGGRAGRARHNRQDSFSLCGSSWFPRAVGLMSHHPCWAFQCSILEGLLASLSAGSPVPLDVELARLVWSLPLPVPGRTLISVSPFSAPTAVTVSLPAANSPLPDLPDGFLECLLTTLDLQNLLDVLGHVLGEHKVLLTSRHPQLLVACAESLRALLFPFEYVHTYVPLLPAVLAEFACSPTPFLMGLCESDEAVLDHDSLPDDVVVVSLDRNQISRRGGQAAPPAYPEKQRVKLIAKLQLHAAVFRAAVERRPPPAGSLLRCTATALDAGAVRGAFLRFWVSLLLKYHGFLIFTRPDAELRASGCLGAFDVARFVLDNPKDARPFLQKLCSTQLFEDFLSRRLLPRPHDLGAVLFEEHLQAKLNRSTRLFGRKMETPFLDDPALCPGSSKSVLVLEPSPRGPDAPYHYPHFPADFESLSAEELGPRLVVPDGEADDLAVYKTVALSLPTLLRKASAETDMAASGLSADKRALRMRAEFFQAYLEDVARLKETLARARQHLARPGSQQGDGLEGPPSPQLQSQLGSGKRGSSTSMLLSLPGEPGSSAREHALSGGDSNSNLLAWPPSSPTTDRDRQGSRAILVTSPLPPSMIAAGNRISRRSTVALTGGAVMESPWFRPVVGQGASGVKADRDDEVRRIIAREKSGAAIADEGNTSPPTRRRGMSALRVEVRSLPLDLSAAAAVKQPGGGDDEAVGDMSKNGRRPLSPSPPPPQPPSPPLLQQQ